MLFFIPKHLLATYLAVYWRWPVAELLHVCHEGALQHLAEVLLNTAGCRILLCLFFCDNRAVVRRGCGKTDQKEANMRKHVFKVGRKFRSLEKARKRSPSRCSGMAMRSQSRFRLYWLLTLEVRLPKGWRGMVPMTSGSSRDNFEGPGMSTHT